MADSVEDKASGRDDEFVEYVRQFQEFCDATMTARAESETCRDYFDGKQWSEAEDRKLRKRGQPVVTDNRIRDKIEAWQGLELATRTDPKSYPRNPQDETAAEASTCALRYIADSNRFPRTKSDVFGNLLIEGTGGAEVVVENRGKRKFVTIRRVRWDRMYWDPHSMLPNFADARYLGIVVWLDLEEAKKKYPSQAESYDAMIDGSFDFGDTFDDRPSMWVDRTRKRVQILEHYCLHDEKGWQRVVLSRAGIIEGPAPSVYKDEDGNPECCLYFQSAYVDRDGNRYGVVKNYISRQDEINKRRSKALHLLNSRQVIADKGAVKDVNKARTELAKPDGFVEVTPGMRFELAPTTDLATGQFQLLKESLDSFAASGPVSAIQGQEAKQSGRAQQVAQQAGMVQLGPVMDGLREWQHRVMVGCWNRVKQFWTDETWVRVTDNEKVRFVALNRKLTRGEVEAEKLKTSGLPPEEIAARVQQIAMNPAATEPVVLNNVSELDVDIVIDEAPDVVTLQSEQWNQLVELAKNGIPIKPETLIKASTIRNKDELVDDIEQQRQAGAGIPPQVAEQLQKAQQQVEAQAQQVKAAQEKLDATVTEIKTASADLKVQKAEVDAARRILAVEVQTSKAVSTARDKARQESEGLQS